MTDNRPTELLPCQFCEGGGEIIDGWTREYVVEVRHAELIAGSPFSNPFREEIVRCRDCIHYKPDPNPIDPGWPMWCEDTGRDLVHPDGFCAWAERRADA